MISRLSESGHYTLKLVSNEENIVKSIPVKKIIDANNVVEVVPFIKEADVIFTAFGQNALKYLAKSIAMGAEKRDTPVNVILCENMIDAHTVLKEYAQSHMAEDKEINKVGLTRASVGRLVSLIKPDDDILTIKAEPYYHLLIDRDGIVGKLLKFS